MELADHNIMSVYIKGKRSVLTHAIFRLKTINICKEPLENPKASVVSNTQENVMEICTNGNMYH